MDYGARLTFRWSASAEHAHDLQEEVVELAKRAGHLARVVRPIGVSMTTWCALELDFQSHAELGAFLDRSRIAPKGGRSDAEAPSTRAFLEAALERRRWQRVGAETPDLAIVDIVSVKPSSIDTKPDS